MARRRKSKVKAISPSKHGRPSRYSPKLAERLCREIATSSKGIRTICKEQGLTQSRVYEWLSAHKDFREQYARAKEFQCQVLFDEIVAIADTPVMGTITKRDFRGLETRTGDMVERSRLRVDARKWALSKLLPKKYGDAQHLAISGADSGPIEHTICFGDGEKPLSQAITAPVITVEPQGESEELLPSGEKPEKEALEDLAPWKLLMRPITTKII